MALFEHFLCVDATGKPVPFAVGDVYSRNDETFTAPLPVTDAAGVALLHVEANSEGVVQPFRTVDPTVRAVVWRSGPHVFPLLSAEGVLESADASAQAAAAAAASATEAAAKALRLPRGGTPPAWWGSFTDATKPTVAEGALEGDLGVLLS